MAGVLRLNHIEGTKSGRSDEIDFKPLPGQRLTLGRDPSCILAFDPYKDARVSAHHADIIWDSGHFFLEDCGSTNGTRINGLKIFERTRLRNNDEVELGRKGSRFRVEFEEVGGNTPQADDAKAKDKDRDRDKDKDKDKDKEKDKDKVGADNNNGKEPVLAGVAKEEKEKDKDKLMERVEAVAAQARDKERDRERDRDRDRAKAAEPEMRDVKAAVAAKARNMAHDAANPKVEVGEGHQVGQQTLNLIWKNAAELGKNSPNGAGSVQLIKEVAKQAASESNSSVKMWLIMLTVFFVLVMVVLGVVIWILVNALNDERDRAKTEDKQLKDQLKTVADRTNLLQDQRKLDSYSIVSPEQAEAQRKREMESTRVALERMEQELATYKANNKSIAEKFQDVMTRYKGSIFLIASSVTLVNKDNQEFRLQSFGTGFIAKNDGYLVTNKHVVEPWKFNEMAAQKERDGLVMKTGSREILAWPCGAEVLAGPNRLKTDTAYSLQRGTLKYYASYPDRLVTQEFKDFGLQKVHATDDNSDLEVLQLVGGPFVALPLYTGHYDDATAWHPDQLNDVMAVGFPQGLAFLDTTTADVSPSLGVIRKIGDTIHISAPIFKGNSGGPIIVFNKQGEPMVIGVVTRVVKETESLGMCIKIEHAINLLPR